MMARRWSQGQIDACAVFHEVDRQVELVEVAELLSGLGRREFNAVMRAFRLYRKSILDQNKERGADIRRAA